MVACDGQLLHMVACGGVLMSNHSDSNLIIWRQWKIDVVVQNLSNVNQCDVFSELIKFVTKPSVWFYYLLIWKDEVLI
jgi:hypothetical protein